MKRSLVTLWAVAGLALGACGASADSAGDGKGVEVAAAFYPLAYAVERVGGDRVDVTNLSKPGTEPHDVELTPKAVATLSGSDLVVFEKGFQPAVDEAIGRADDARILDVASTVDLTVVAADDGHDHGGEHTEEHADEAAVDPHFWLDPTRYAKAVEAIAAELAAVDPAGATAYARNAETFVAELTALDAEFAAGLKHCANRDLVTGHVAFAYLADRYDLHQSGIAGLSPDAEPSAGAMKEIVEHIREHEVTTIYAGALVSKDLTETIAKETGTTVAVLDPLEGLTESSAGNDYLEVMRSNLATLKKGQVCR
ncbi:metal ABC transporter substrate-binding protein [Knoellia sinensis]|nr:metal ABC transporter substrate-binding protein [Knoellia sinensis]